MGLAFAAAGGAPRHEPVRLRQDLTLRQVGQDGDGAALWVLHDPAANRYFRLSWTDVAMLHAVERGAPDAVAAELAREAGVRVTPDEVEEFTRFLRRNALVAADGEGGRKRLRDMAARTRVGGVRWLLRSYLSLRIPLVRPDRFLARTAWLVAWCFHPATRWIVAAVGLAGLLLTARQADVYFRSFLHFFNLEGALLFGGALAGVKVLHELGHAYTAHRLGCRVATMGVGLMLLWPVLYTDASDAWRLPSRRQRLAIAAAGIKVELAIAALALFVWNLLPEGPARSVCFVLSSSTWLLTLTINLNPLMRFDGYFILSDALGIENLHERAVAAARWRMREFLYGLGDPPPPGGAGRPLAGFGVAVWLYRFLLFFGYAAIVYHLVFKALGLLLVAFLAYGSMIKPLVQEVRTMAARRAGLRFNHAMARSAVLLALLGAALFVPWRTTVTLPAVYRAERHTVVYAPAGGRVAELAVAPGGHVAAGQPILTVETPDIDFRIDQTRREIEILEWQLSVRGLRDAFLGEQNVLSAELRSQAEQLRTLLRQRERNRVPAPFDGTVIDLQPGIRTGSWIARNEAVLSVVAPESAGVVAYVTEADLGRLGAGMRGRFFPRNADFPPFDVEVDRIDGFALRELDTPYAASTFGGDVAVTATKDNALVPVEATFQVHLRGQGAARLPEHVVLGRITVHGQPEALAARLFRRAVGVFQREAGF